MKRAQLQLDDETHEALRRRSYEEGRSVASLVRESLDQYLGTGREKKKLGPEAFLFVGCGRSGGSRVATNTARQHDEAFAEAIESRRRRKGRRSRPKR